MTRGEAICCLEDLKDEYEDFPCDEEALIMAIEALKQSEYKKGKKFVKIVVEYPAVYPYPEYPRRPYFAIQYEENGEQFEGFGTYNPEVLSQYIREYFMSEKKGKWIDAREYCSEFMCSNCHRLNRNNTYNFCPDCGARMEGRAMTISDAIKHLSYKIAYYKGSASKHANDVLVEALELAVIALEKEKELGVKVRRLCPACGKDVVGSGYYCWNCGQHLRWEEE